MTTSMPGGTLAADLFERSDAELLAASRTGDTDAYGELFRRHAPAATALARRLTGHPSDADDLVSESFTKVLAALRNGNGPTSAMRPYLLTAVRRVHVDRAVAGQKVQPTDDMSAHDPGVPFIDPALAGLERSMVAQAYQQLPERWQMVLWHTEVEELSPKEIAPLLGMSPNAVAALALRARAGLREAYLAAHVTQTTSPECERMLPKLAAYVRGSAATRERAAVDKHLPECENCRAVLAELEDVGGRMRAVVAPLVLGLAAAGYLADLATLPSVAAAPAAAALAKTAAATQASSTSAAAGTATKSVGKSSSSSASGSAAAGSNVGGWLIGAAATAIVVGGVAGALALAANQSNPAPEAKDSTSSTQPGNVAPPSPPSGSATSPVGPNATTTSPPSGNSSNQNSLANRTSTISPTAVVPTNPTSPVSPTSVPTTPTATTPAPVSPTTPPVSPTTSTPTPTTPPTTTTPPSTPTTTPPVTTPTTPTSTTPKPPTQTETSTPTPTTAPADQIKITAPATVQRGVLGSDMTLVVPALAKGGTVTISTPSPLLATAAKIGNVPCSPAAGETIVCEVPAGETSTTITVRLSVTGDSIAGATVPVKTSLAVPGMETDSVTTQVKIEAAGDGVFTARYTASGKVSQVAATGTLGTSQAITLPSNTIRFARLYWSAPVADSEQPVTLQLNGNAVALGSVSSHTVKAAKAGADRYLASADVLDAVQQAAKTGQDLNTVANGATGVIGSWTLIVVADDPNAASSRITVFDGGVQLINGGTDSYPTSVGSSSSSVLVSLLTSPKRGGGATRGSLTHGNDPSLDFTTAEPMLLPYGPFGSSGELTITTQNDELLVPVITTIDTP